MYTTGFDWFAMLEGQIVLPVQAMEAYVRSRDPAPLVLNLGAEWRWATSRPGCVVPDNEFRCPLNSWLRGPQSRSVSLAEEKNLLSLPEFEPRSSGLLPKPLHLLRHLDLLH